MQGWWDYICLAKRITDHVVADVLEAKEAVHIWTSYSIHSWPTGPSAIYQKLVFLVTSIQLGLRNALNKMTNLGKKLSDCSTYTTQLSKC